MKRCLISGASGLIGGYLAKELAAHGLFVRGFARTPGTGCPACDEFVQADILDPPSLAAVTAGMDTLFHLAGPAGAEDDDAPYQRRLHVEGSLNLLRAAHTAGVRRMVYFSSVKAIDPGRHRAYGEAKREAEQAIRAVLAETGMSGIILRPAAVYGPGGKGMLASLLRATDRGYLPALPDSRNRRSLVHVADLAHAAYLAVAKAGPECPAYTVSDGHSYSARQIQRLMGAALGKTGTPPALPLWVWKAAAKAGDGARRLTGRKMPFDSDLLERLLESAEYNDGQANRALGFEPRYTLETALPEIVAHYRQAELRGDPHDPIR